MSMTNETGSTRTLSALFDTRAEADRAVAALEAAGIADVVLTGSQNAGYGATAQDSMRDSADRDKGFFEQLGDFFFPDEDRYTYAEGLNRGGFLVTVDNIPVHQYDRALDILDDEGAVDLDAREAEWRGEGWTNEGPAFADRSGGLDYARHDDGMPGTMASRAVDGLAGGLTAGGYDEGAPGTMASRAADRAGDAMTGRQDEGLQGTMASRAMDRAADALGDDRRGEFRDLDSAGNIEIAEESLRISKREHDLGRVRVRSYVKETPVEETVNLREERVSIERRPVDRAATDADFREQTMEAREYAEEAVVSKEARIVEEVSLRSETESHDEVVRDSIRKTEVEIVDERDNADMLDADLRREDGSLRGDAGKL